MLPTRRDFLAALTLAALARPAFAKDRAQVVATTGMIADTAARIGGRRVAVRGLMGSGVDPHSYRQTRSDILALIRADLVLWHGLYLEAQMEEFLFKLAKRRDVAAVGEAVPEALRIAHTDYDGRFDPHVWMAPELWMHVAAQMATPLTRVMPEHAAEFADNVAVYHGELRRLHDYAQNALGSVPKAARVLVTAHDAFGYFGRAYGFEVEGIQGISTDSEAGLNRIGTLVDMLVARRIKAVFVESSVSDRNIRALVEGAAARGHDLRIGGALYSDAMGRPGSYEGTYIGMIDHNVTTIARALGGDVPARGMDGKLAEVA